MANRPVRAALFVLPGVMLFAANAAAQEGYKVIVNTQNPVNSLSKAQVSDLFLKKATTWEDGQAVLPVEQVETSPLREAFSREVLGMSPNAATQAVSKRGDPTPSVATDREVLAYVRLKPGAIGYVSASTPVQGVKTISVGGKGGDVTTTVASREPIRVGAGGAVPAPEKVFNVPPEYPAPARAARTEGTVDLDILISPSGTVEDARVISGNPMLSQAAISAVKRWKYAPTVINGTPVPVRMVAKVAFVLH